jgi:C4-type Zn-finger protein
MNAKCPRCGYRQSLDLEIPEIPEIGVDVAQYKITCEKCRNVYYVDVP